MCIVYYLYSNMIVFCCIPQNPMFNMTKETLGFGVCHKIRSKLYMTCLLEFWDFLILKFLKVLNTNYFDVTFLYHKSNNNLILRSIR